jgi:hypothetical protein
VGGLNNYGPCVITDSHRAVKVNAPDVVKRNNRDNHRTGHAAVTTRPGLLNGNGGSELRNFDADGCHVTRNIPALIKEGGFRIEQMETGYLARFPKSGSYYFWGVARPEL